MYTKGKNIRVGAQGANYHPCKNMFSNFVDPVPPSSCLWSSVQRKKHRAQKNPRPYPNPEIFGLGLRGYAPCKNIVMLSCLVWKTGPPIFMYMVFYEAKRHRARKDRRSLPRGLKFSWWSFWDSLRPL